MLQYFNDRGISWLMCPTFYAIRVFNKRRRIAPRQNHKQLEGLSSDGLLPSSFMLDFSRIASLFIIPVYSYTICGRHT